MDTIVIRSRGRETDPYLVQTLLQLFPDCRVVIAPPGEGPESAREAREVCARFLGVSGI